MNKPWNRIKTRIVGDYIFSLMLIIIGVNCVSCNNEETSPTGASPSIPSYYCSLTNVTYHSETDYRTNCVIKPVSSSLYIPVSSSVYIPKSSSSSRPISSSSVTTYTKNCGNSVYTTTDKTCYEYATCTYNSLYHDASCGSLVSESAKPSYCKNEYTWDVHMAGCTNKWTKK